MRLDIDTQESVEAPASFELADERTPMPWLFFMIAAMLGVGAAVAPIVGWAESGTMLLLLVLAIPIGVLARRLPGERDGRWLPNLIMGAWIAKMLASAARYWALQVLYRGVGDASGYHGAGRRWAPVWRALEVPVIDPGGTGFVDAATGFLYTPYIPSKLGGFFIYATLAFLGQILLYLAFRRAFPTARLGWYAGLVFFFPNLLYWPASIGKDSLMLLFIGTAAYAAARVLTEFRLRWVFLFGVGVAGCAAIRTHIALALAAALLLAMLIGRSEVEGVGHRRVVALIGIAALLIPVARVTFADFSIDPSLRINQVLATEVIDPVFSGVEEQTGRGGSEVQGRAIRSVVDVPAAAIRVFFRPLPWEAHNAQALANSLVEGTLLLALLVWRAPVILRRLPQMWRSPFVLFAFIYSAGFMYGHSAILNLGIMARQRSQVIPFVLVLLVALGFESGERQRADAFVAP